VEHPAHLVFIICMGHSPVKLRRSQPAHRALAHAHRRRKACRLHPHGVAAPPAQHILFSCSLRSHPRNACLTNSHRRQRSHSGPAYPAIGRHQNVREISDRPLHRRTATSKHACHRAPSGLAGITTRRPAISELDIPHACAEDEPHSRHSKKNTSCANRRSITLPPFQCNECRRTNQDAAPTRNPLRSA